MNISTEITGLIDEIKNDKIHGASQLARQAANVIKVAAEHSQAETTVQFLDEQKETGQKLMSARPAMAPISNIISHLLSTIAEKAAKTDLDSIKQFTISRVDKVITDSLQAIAKIAEQGSALIANGDRIMTHSYSSTVAASLKMAFTQHRNIEVITTRSGPRAHRRKDCSRTQPPWNTGHLH